MGEQTNASGEGPPVRPGASRPYDGRYYGGDDDINLLDYVRVVWVYKLWIIASTAAFTLLAIIWALLTTPVYRADVVMMPARDEGEQGGGLLSSIAGQYSGLASLAGIDLGGGGGSTTEAVATLESRTFVQQFIEEEQLLPLLFPKRWDAEKQVWRGEDPTKTPTLRDATKLFLEIQNVTVENDTGLVRLSIDWTDRELASRWANLLVERVNELLRQRAIAQAQESMRYLGDELEKTSVLQLQQAIYRMIEGQINTIMLANVREEYAFRVIDPAPALGPQDRIRPQRTIMVMVGGLFGGFVGLFIALARNFFVNQQARR